MTTVEQRLIVLETEFRTELKHLATKADLKSLEMRMAGLVLSTNIAIGVAIVAALRLWQ